MSSLFYVTLLHISPQNSRTEAGREKVGSQTGKVYSLSVSERLFPLLGHSLVSSLHQRGVFRSHKLCIGMQRESRSGRKPLTMEKESFKLLGPRPLSRFRARKNNTSRESPEKHSTVYVRTFLERIIALSSRGLITKQFRGCFTPLKIASSDLQHQFNTNHRFRRTHYGSICIAIFVMSLLDPRCDPVIRTNLTRESGTKRDGWHGQWGNVPFGTKSHWLSSSVPIRPRLISCLSANGSTALLYSTRVKHSQSKGKKSSGVWKEIYDAMQTWVFEFPKSSLCWTVIIK